MAIAGQCGTVLMETLTRPSRPISVEAAAVHGIDEAAVAGAPPFERIWESLQSLLSSRLVVAYTADFDARLLEQSARAHGVAFA